MHMNKLVVTVILSVLLYSCQSNPHRILYVNSYHSGYPPSDEIMLGLLKNLPDDSFDCKIVMLDSKTQLSKDSIQAKIDSIIKLVEFYKPEILAVSDDNAMKYLVEPYAAKFNIPVVFCGVNWSADQYIFDKQQVTGMLEVLPLHKALETLMEAYPKSRKLAVVSENSLSEQNNKRILDTLYLKMGLSPEYYLVDDFQAWKEVFIAASKSCDIIYLPTNGGVKNWDNAEAEDFVLKNITKPVFTCDDFMMPFAVFGLTKVPEEQGTWMASAIKKILNGTPAGSISIVKNSQSKTWINTVLAKKIDFRCDSAILENVIKIN